MRKRSMRLGMITLLLGLLAVFLASRAFWVEWERSRRIESETNRLRQLASIDDPGLADLLDGSVIYIGSGDFLMGSNDGRPDEYPQRSVYLDAFEIGRYEVTNAQYWRFIKATERMPPPYWSEGEYPPGQADYPVVGVSWEDADAYCKWVGKRLPTEAEWEKACRGADGRIYPWGNTWDSGLANVYLSGSTLPLTDLNGSQPATRDSVWKSLLATPSSPGELGLRPVGSYPRGASSYGVMDLVGNTSEWVSDWYNWSDYSEMPTRNPYGSAPPWNHSLRGSSWYQPASNPDWVQNLSRCSARNSSHVPTDPRLGFRCARTILDGTQ